MIRTRLFSVDVTGNIQSESFIEQSEIMCLKSPEFVAWFFMDRDTAPEIQKGTPWLPAANATDEEFDLDQVEVLYSLYKAQFVLSVIGFLACCFLCVMASGEGLPGIIHS